MYSPPELTNNPFVNSPSNPHTRFPDINTLNNAAPGPSSGLTPQYTSTPGYGLQAQGGAQGYGYQQQSYQPMQSQATAQQPQYQYQQQQPQQPQAYGGGWSGSTQPDQYGGMQAMATGMGAGMGAGYPGTPGQGSGALGAQMTGMPFQSYMQYQQQQAYAPQPQMTGAYTGYGGQGQQQPQTQSYLSEFDPYSNSRNQDTQPRPGTSNSSTSPNSRNQPHPREYVRSHKAELELWDTYNWKQALSAFDALRASWENRKEEIAVQVRQAQMQGGYGAQGGYGPQGGYGMQGAYGYNSGPNVQEVTRLQGLQKEADHNIDTVAAASVQMQEVFSGYRHSGDLASKSRVRESLNAALRDLPDWPQS